jgi:hypothetical protein
MESQYQKTHIMVITRAMRISTTLTAFDRLLKKHRIQKGSISLKVRDIFIEQIRDIIQGRNGEPVYPGSVNKYLTIATFENLITVEEHVNQELALLVRDHILHMHPERPTYEQMKTVGFSNKDYPKSNFVINILDEFNRAYPQYAQEGRVHYVFITMLRLMWAQEEWNDQTVEVYDVNQVHEIIYE